MTKKTKDLLTLALAASAAVASLYFAFGSRSPKIDLGTYSALGAVTGEETARVMGGQGRVLVIARDTGEDKIPSVEAQLEAFLQTIKKHRGLTATVDRFQAPAMLMMATGGGVPPEHLAKAVSAHGDIGALVLFCGLPPMADAELATLKKRGVKTVVVASFRPDYARLLEEGTIHLAIVPKPDDAPPSGPPPRTLRQRFDQDYLILSAGAPAASGAR